MVMMPPYSVGVEEEYQLVDPRSGALRSAAPRVLDGDWSGELRPEMLQTMVEVATPPLRSAEEVGAELARLRFQAATTAAAHDLAIVAAGVHPCDAWRSHKTSHGARYAHVAERLGHVARTDHIFGMHVHVEVPTGVDRMQVIAAARPYLPHLTALAASSPVYDREDTGYASYRTILSDRLPNSGMPPALRSERDFERLLQVMLQSGVLPDAASLYWGLRPHSRYPTVEFRVMDACPRIGDAVAIAALIRALVATIAEEGIEVRGDGFAAHTADVLLRANQWQACRYGLDAAIITPATPAGWEPLREAVRTLVDRVAPAAEALGDAERIAGVLEILERGTSADHIRERHDPSGDTSGLVAWLCAETLNGTGMEESAAASRPVGEMLPS